MIEEALGGIPWLAQAATASRKRYVLTAAQKVEAVKKGTIKVLAPTHPDSAARKTTLETAIQAAAAKMKTEADARTKKAQLAAQERQEALVRVALVEHLRLMLGKKQAPTPPALVEKFQKACKCHLEVATGSGLHLDKCPLSPFRLKSTLNQHAQSRANIREQLAKRTSLAPVQVEAAVLHLFGPEVPRASGPSSSSTGSLCSRFIEVFSLVLRFSPCCIQRTLGGDL